MYGQNREFFLKKSLELGLNIQIVFGIFAHINNEKMKRYSVFPIFRIGFRFFLFFVLFFSIVSCKNSQINRRIELSEWKFTYEDKEYSAQIPGCIHTDLLNNQLIEDPFFGNREDSLQWIGERMWVYTTTFDKSQIDGFDHVELVFDGIDTHADIFLNGEPLMHVEGGNHVNNMFRQWRFPLPDNLKDGKNFLEVKFLPAPEYERAQAEKLPYKLPEERAFSRKAPYQSGWDWGPKFVTCGMWQSVYFDCWNNIKVGDFQIVQSLLNTDSAVVQLPFTIQSDRREEVEVIAQIDGKTYYAQTITLQKGSNLLQPQLIVQNPQLWYPNGMGEAKLYDIRVLVKHGKNIYQQNHRWGFRTIELVQKTDSIGKSFEFVVNGTPIFIKGVNWIPAEAFISEMSGKKGKEKYKALLQDSKDSHLNMVRIWGGGIYENEAFYDYCDEMGLLVWQDFIFSCALYPGDAEFLANVEKEAEYQVKRLRNHPSLALWCGNNEVKNGWEDWGWQANYAPEHRAQLDHDLHLLFDTLLARVVEQHDMRQYHPSSPAWGWGHKESFTEGDAHYWGVWWGELPFDVWYEKTGRFMSEYGFQSYPEISTIETYTKPEDRHFHSVAFKNHQKHNRGFYIINKEIENRFGRTFWHGDAPILDSTEKSLSDYVYLSQLTQAYGIQQAIEIHRLRRPYCMGTLYWQLNDCWPVASWSSIDYYGNWKALQYAVKKSCEPIIVVPYMVKPLTYDLYVVSDLQKDIKGKMVVSALTIDGQLISSDTITGIAKANSSEKIAQWQPKKYPNIAENGYLKVTFIDDLGEKIAEKITTFDKPKYLKNQPNVQMDVNVTEQGWQLTLTSDKFVQGVQIFTAPYISGKYSDNYLTLEPNKPVQILFTPRKNKEKEMNFDIRYFSSLF